MTRFNKPSVIHKLMTANNDAVSALCIKTSSRLYNGSKCFVMSNLTFLDDVIIGGGVVGSLMTFDDEGEGSYMADILMT